ncbi:MAG: hypothetical protein ACOC4E_02855 [Patescibacteria group bacterium]
MDTVVLDGVQYLKVAVAAKQFDYTPDYLGQLCRAGKLDARLVGRTWFVNPESVAEHKAGTYRGEKEASAAEQRAQPRSGTHVSQATDSKEDEHDVRNNKIKQAISAPPAKQQKRTVASPVKNKTVKTISSFQERLHQYGATTGTRYEPDEAPLYPMTQSPRDQTAAPGDKSEASQPERTESASSVLRSSEAPSAAQGVSTPTVERKRLKVRGERRTTKFTGTELPEVSLQGKLVVEEAPDQSPPDEKDRNANENTVISPGRGTAIAMTNRSYKRRKRVRRSRTKVRESSRSVAQRATAQQSSETVGATRASSPAESDEMIYYSQADDQKAARGLFGYRVHAGWVWSLVLLGVLLGGGLVLVESPSLVTASDVEQTWQLRLDIFTALGE